MKKIFIIHGWTYTMDAWQTCLAELTAQGYTPVVLAVPGLTEASGKVWTLNEYVVWLGEKLSAEKDVVLVGHSNGGRIAIAYTAKNPGKISKLVLIDSAGIFHDETGLRARRAVFGFFAKVGKRLTRSPFVRKVFYKLIGAKDYGRAPANMRETMTNLIAVDLTLTLSDIAVPTLIIWGEDDKATPVSDAHLMHDKIKNSRLVIIPGVGHSPHAAVPQKVAGEITGFAFS